MQVLWKKLKEAEDLAADQLSRFQNPHMEELTEREFADKFSDKHLMVLKSKFKDNEPWHHSANVTAKKVYEAGFYWPSVFKDANEYVRQCDACQISGNISLRNEMPQNNIQLFETDDLLMKKCNCIMNVEPQESCLYAAGFCTYGYVGNTKHLKIQPQ
ncbi:reverse transcriptase domain-containing protein [Tanacetum coccineum]